VLLASACANGPIQSTGPTGFILSGGPGGTAGSLLVIDGCASRAPGAQAVYLKTQDVTGPGSYTSGAAAYADGMGNQWSGGQGFFLAVDQLGPVGSSISGKFGATVTGSGAPRMVQGTFTVCRLPDERAL
jgi:hypothetical protein